MSSKILFLGTAQQGFFADLQLHLESCSDGTGETKRVNIYFSKARMRIYHVLHREQYMAEQRICHSLVIDNHLHA